MVVYCLGLRAGVCQALTSRALSLALNRLLSPSRAGSKEAEGASTPSPPVVAFPLPPGGRPLFSASAAMDYLTQVPGVAPGEAAVDVATGSAVDGFPIDTVGLRWRTVGGGLRLGGVGLSWMAWDGLPWWPCCVHPKASRCGSCFSGRR